MVKDAELIKAMEVKDEEFNKLLQEKNEELEYLDHTNSALFTKQFQTNVEIQDAYKELISGMRDLSGDRSKIGVKMMGKVDEKPFIKIFEQRFSDKNIQLEHAAMLVSKWQEEIYDQAWYPFKRVGTEDNMKEIVDDEDKKLRSLSEEFGEEVKNAVKIALEELNEFNPSGRYIFPLLWNFHYGRKATLKEGIVPMIQQIRLLKRKRT